MLVATTKTFSQRFKIVTCNNLSNSIRVITKVPAMDRKSEVRELTSAFSRMRCSHSVDLMLSEANEALPRWETRMNNQTRLLNQEIEAQARRCNRHALSKASSLPSFLKTKSSTKARHNLSSTIKGAA